MLQLDRVTKHYLNHSLEDIEGEIWKDVIDYEGLYKVSNKGRIKSLERITPQGKMLGTKILSLGLDKDKYPQAILCRDGITKSRKVHRIELICFKPNLNNRPCINHIDGIKWNNELENLEWCTISENTLHSYKLGLQTPNVPKGAAHALSKKVIQYDLEESIVNQFGSVREAMRITNINRSGIMQACRKERGTFGGFKWEYA